MSLHHLVTLLEAAEAVRNDIKKRHDDYFYGAKAKALHSELDAAQEKVDKLRTELRRHVG